MRSYRCDSDEMATATAHERTMPRWQRSLLPAVLGADRADRGQNGTAHLPRSLRDWVVDLIMFGFALALGAAGAWHDAKHAPGWWIAIDVLIGLAACGALWVRRDYPLAVGLGTIGVSAFSGMAGGAAVVGMFTVAIYCPPRRTLQVMVLSFATSAVYAALYTGGGRYHVSDLAAGIAATIIAAAWGLFVRARRELRALAARAQPPAASRAGAARAGRPASRARPDRAGDARRARAPDLAAEPARRSA